jgi:death-on-curing protein
LVINGAGLQADPDDTYKFIVGLYEAGSFSFEPLAAWLRRVVVTSGT